MKQYDESGLAGRAAEIRDDLAKLNGEPPYNTPSNICWNDAYFGKSLERKYGATIDELQRIVGRR